ncbi:MAG: hypothetical protein IB618_03620 [Candidatus Pacearchaeota archaeon]|nr:MAG: hypothetical protein IB618_03620 [Candidatus Pacearchaeota archaeon]
MDTYEIKKKAKKILPYALTAIATLSFGYFLFGNKGAASEPKEPVKAVRTIDDLTVSELIEQKEDLFEVFGKMHGIWEENVEKAYKKVHPEHTSYQPTPPYQPPVQPRQEEKGPVWPQSDVPQSNNYTPDIDY